MNHLPETDSRQFSAVLGTLLPADCRIPLVFGSSSGQPVYLPRTTCRHLP